MAILTPVNITHNNPELPTVYFSDIKGNIWATGSDGNQYGIPEGKRELGMIVYFSSSQDFKYYKGGTTASADWASPLSWSMFGGGTTYLEGPGIDINSNYISASLGAGLEFDENSKIQSQVRTVNLQIPTNGNISLSITNTITGPSSSLSGSPFFLPDTYSPRPPVSGTIFVVSGDIDANKNGNAYIFVTSSTQPGSWQQIFGFNETTADLRYVRLSSDTTQNISSSLNITGSVTFLTSSTSDKITFSSSLYWLSGSHGATTPGAGVTSGVVILGNDGRLYITGAYGAGGSGTPSAPINSVQFNNNSTFGGDSTLTFTPPTASNSSVPISSSLLNLLGRETISGSLILRNPANISGSIYIASAWTSSLTLQVIGTSSFTGSLIVSSSFQLIGTGSITGSLIVSSSSNVIGTSRVTGSLIVSSSSQIIGTETITGSLIVSSSSNVIGFSRVTGSLIVSNSFSTIGTGSISGSLFISSSVPGQTALQIIGTGSNTTAPMVQIAGQTGAFVQVYDFNSGSLFSVNSNTGTSIIDVISTGQTLIGSNTYQGMYDSTGYASMPAPGQVLTIPGYITSSYNALWFEYFVTTGSYSRAGLFHTSWSGSLSSSIDTTSSFLGTVPVNNISFTASISGAFMQLIASASTNGWLIKGSIRGI